MPAWQMLQGARAVGLVVLYVVRDALRGRVNTSAVPDNQRTQAPDSVDSARDGGSCARCGA